jgi:hypothetical protein
MERKPTLLLWGIILLVMITAAAVALDFYAWRGQKEEETRVFQRAVGGLGMGAIATPIWQFINYDARVLSVDDSITWPVPGGYSYGPDRTGTVSYFKEMAEDEWIIHTP